MRTSMLQPDGMAPRSSTRCHWHVDPRVDRGREVASLALEALTAAALAGEQLAAPVEHVYAVGARQMQASRLVDHDEGTAECADEAGAGSRTSPRRPRDASDRAPCTVAAKGAGTCAAAGVKPAQEAARAAAERQGCQRAPDGVGLEPPRPVEIGGIVALGGGPRCVADVHVDREARIGGEWREAQRVPVEAVPASISSVTTPAPAGTAWV